MTEKKKHLYAVVNNGLTTFVLAHARQQAISAIASRSIIAVRAEAMDVLNAGLTLKDVVDATVAPTQEPLPLTTAAEEMEPT